MSARLNILIVDNSPEELMQLFTYMEQDYDLDDVSTGEACLSRVGYDRPDLILLDDMIAAPNCYDICQTLKSDPQTVSVPIILMSDLSAEELSKEADSIGSDDFICKPIHKDELLEKVVTLLSFARVN